MSHTAILNATGKSMGTALSGRFAGHLSFTLGGVLRNVFDEVAAQPLPAIFLDLLDQLAAVERVASPVPQPTPAGQLDDVSFKHELTAVIPQLRAFARSLSGNRDTADDLVQEALLKAWTARARFQAGTNMRAWTFIILRNLFLSQMRRARFTGVWDEVEADRILAAPSSQDKEVELSDLQRALMYLPQNQREAVILIGAGGFSYEEAADICGCAVGTIKSRVARGRVALEELMAGGSMAPRSHTPTSALTAHDQIMAQVDALTSESALLTLLGSAAV